MIGELTRDLYQSRNRILDEMSRFGSSVTANKITRTHGYLPRGNMLYLPDGSQEHPEIKSKIWHATFLESSVYEPFPDGYNSFRIRVQTAEDKVVEFLLLYRHMEVAMIDDEGHFGVLPHTRDVEGAESLADYYGVHPVLKEPSRTVKDFIEGLDLSGI